MLAWLSWAFACLGLVGIVLTCWAYGQTWRDEHWSEGSGSSRVRFVVVIALLKETCVLVAQCAAVGSLMAGAVMMRSAVYPWGFWVRQWLLCLAVSALSAWAVVSVAARWRTARWRMPTSHR